MKTEKKPLTKDELRFIMLRRDENSLQLMGMNAQLAMAEKEIELNIPMRKANENLANIKENINKTELNAKFYNKEIREGREVPVNVSQVEEVEAEAQEVEEEVEDEE